MMGRPSEEAPSEEDLLSAPPNGAQNSFGNQWQCVDGGRLALESNSLVGRRRDNSVWFRLACKKIVGVEVGEPNPKTGAPGTITLHYLAPRRKMCIPWDLQPHGLKLKTHVVSLLESENKEGVAFRPVHDEQSETPSKPATGTSARAIAKEIREASCGNHRRRIFVLANPKSGSGKASRVVPWMETFLHRAELAEVTVHYTRYRGDARELVATLDLNLYDTLLVGGGDGLIQEVINGLVKDHKSYHSSKIAIGVIPLGSSNSLACSTGVFTKEQTLQRLVYPNTNYYTDLMQVSHPAPAPEVRLDMFPSPGADDDGSVLYATCAFSYGVMGKTAVDSENNRWMGPVRYAVEAFKLVVLGPPCPVGRLQWETLEGEAGEYEGPLPICLATAHNAAVSQFPNGCAAPYGAVGDGGIELMFKKTKLSRVRLLRILSDMGKGNHLDRKQNGIVRYQVKKFSLGGCGGQMRLGCPVALDGEPAGDHPLEVSVCVRMVRMI